MEEGRALEDDFIFTILHYGSVDDLAYLLDFDMTLHRCNELRWNSFPLGQLVDKKKFSMILMLLDNAVEPHGKDHHGRDLALLACERNYESLVFAILPRLLTSGTPNTALLNSAANRGLTEIAKYLIDLDADVNATFGFTVPLHILAPMRLMSREYRHPLHAACRNGHIEIVKLLLQHGANVHNTDQKGQTAFHYAAESGYVEVMSLLIEYGAIPHCLDSNLRSPFYYAALQGRAEAMEFLDPSGDKIAVFQQAQERGWFCAQFSSLIYHGRIETI